MSDGESGGGAYVGPIDLAGHPPGAAWSLSAPRGQRSWRVLRRALGASIAAAACLVPVSAQAQDPLPSSSALSAFGGGAQTAAMDQAWQESLTAASAAGPAPVDLETAGASLGLYTGMDRAQALALAREKFAALMLRPLWQGPVLAPGEQSTVYVGDRAMRMKRPGVAGGAFIESTLPLRSSVRSGYPAPVDVTLEDRGAVYAPRNPLVAVDLAKDPAQGMLFPARGVRVRPTNVSPFSVAESTEGKLFFANAWPDTDYVVAPVPGGAQAFYVLRSAASPASYELAVDIDRGGAVALAADGSGAVEIRGSEPLARIAPPAAWDAEGRPVPVHYEVEGNRVAVVVARDSEPFTSRSSSIPRWRTRRTGRGAWILTPPAGRPTPRGRRSSGAT